MILSPAFQELLEKTKKDMKPSLKLISMGVLVSPLILGCVVFFYLKTQPPIKFGLQGLFPVIINIFIVLSATTLISSVMLCHKLYFTDKHINKMLSREVKVENLAFTKEKGINTALLEKLKQLNGPELKVFAVLIEYPGWFFLGHSLAEISAILGFLLAFFTGGFNIYLYFAGPSVAVMVYNITRIDELIEKLDKKLRNRI